MALQKTAKIISLICLYMKPSMCLKKLITLSSVSTD